MLYIYVCVLYIYIYYSASQIRTVSQPNWHLPIQLRGVEVLHCPGHGLLRPLLGFGLRQQLRAAVAEALLVHFAGVVETWRQIPVGMRTDMD